MSDNLENFIRQNRGKFDDKEPTEKVWKRIYKRLNDEDKSSFVWIWKAAAILFFLSSSFLLYQLKLDNTNLAMSKKQLNEDFQTVESYYVQKISEKKELIYDFEESDLNVDETFEQDLRKLEAMYEVLKDELKENPSKKVVDALILNLLVRIDILNSQLEELEGDSPKIEEDKEINV